METVTLYHGSASPSLVNDGSGQFGALFCANFGYAKKWGEHVYALTVQRDAIMPSSLDEDVAWPALCEVLGIDADDADEAQKELLISMIVHDVSFDSPTSPAWDNGPDGVGDAIGSVLDFFCADEDDVFFETQKMRIALTQKLGYAACWMADEVGSLAVLPGTDAVAAAEEIESVE